MKNNLARVITLVPILLILAVPASAQSRYVWGGGSGSWDDLGRWSPSGVPAAADTAVINSGTATLVEDTEVAGFELHGFGVVSGNADLTVTAAMVSSGGGAGFTSVQGSGTVTVASGATLLLTGPGNRQFSSGRTLVNAGTATWEMTGQFTGSGQVVNEGEMIISFDAPEPARLCFQSNPQGITNTSTGVIRRTGTGEAQFSCIFNNHGLVRVEQGALDLSGFHPTSGDDTGAYEVGEGAVLVFGGGTRTMAASSSVTGAGTVEIRGGTTTLAGMYDIPTTRMLSGFGRFDFDGDATTATLTQERHNLGGSGTLTVTDSYVWTEGNLSGSGALVVAPGATLSIEGAGTKRIENAWTLRNEGTGTWAATIGGGTIHNAGTLELGDGAVANSLRVINTGDLTKIGPGVVTLSGTQSFANSGTVTVSEGTLTVRGAAPSTPDTGTYAVAEGATLNLASNARTLAPEAVLMGTGTLRFESRPVVNQGTIRPGLSPGTLTFDGNHPAMEAEGVLEIELAGYEPGLEHDQFAVTGTAALGGVLRVVLLDGFVPQEADRFLILSAASVTGEFGALDLPDGLDASVEVVAEGVELVISRAVSAGAEGAPPLVFALEAPYPNPGTSAASVRFTLAEGEEVRLEAFDALGRRVAVFAEGPLAAGHHVVTWEAGALPAGLYILRLTAGPLTAAQRWLLLR